MAFGFGVLRLHSDAFWSLTPRELASALAGVSGRAHGALDDALVRSALEDLMKAFPDGV